jgi:hypothetical protein
LVAGLVVAVHDRFGLQVGKKFYIGALAVFGTTNLMRTGLRHWHPTVAGSVRLGPPDADLQQLRDHLLRTKSLLCCHCQIRFSNLNNIVNLAQKVLVTSQRLACVPNNPEQGAHQPEHTFYVRVYAG